MVALCVLCAGTFTGMLALSGAKKAGALGPPQPPPPWVPWGQGRGPQGGTQGAVADDAAFAARMAEVGKRG